MVLASTFSPPPSSNRPAYADELTCLVATALIAVVSAPEKKSRRFAAILIVIAIVVFIVGIIMPIRQRLRETSGRVPCASNLRIVGQALLLYQMDHGGVWPKQLTD